MNRTDRLLAIVLELQARGGARAEDLARTFEVSKRTIYRDITALSEARVPIIASPGTGYRLMEGYFLPPLSFTPDEAAVLVLGVHAVRFAVDTRYRQAVQMALRKLDAVLPREARERVQELHESMRIFGGWASAEDTDKVAALRAAILERRVTHIQYQSPRDEHPIEREVEPYSLAYYRGVWHLNAYCRLRTAMREFRLDRIDGLAVLDETFERDPERAEQVRHRHDAGLLVRVRFAARMLRWVREERHWSFHGEEPDGVMRFAVEEPADIVPWLLRWGDAAEVIEPDSVRAAVAEEARRITNIYSAVPVPLT
jgi:predicted DNA-binding transcriptional regulator YafY